MKKFIIYGLLITVLICGIAYKQCSDDKKIEALAKEIKKGEVERQKDKLEILDQKGIIKLANEKVAKSEKEKNASKLSLMDQGKTFDEEIEKINKLRKANKLSFEITVVQWKKALTEIGKYKKQVADLDTKWKTLYDDLKKLHFKDTGKLIKQYEKMFAKLEKEVSDYKKLTIRLAKKVDRVFNFPTANINVITLPGGGNYFSAGIGGSINLKRLIFGKSKIPQLLLGG